MQLKLAWVFHLISILLHPSKCQDQVGGEFEENSARIEIPPSNFRCEDQQWPGYYADVDNDCQVFHICVDRITRMEKFSFFCPAGTVFSQELLVCVWPFDFDCHTSPSFYGLNELLYSNQYQEIPRNSRKLDDGKVLAGNSLELPSMDAILEPEKVVIDQIPETIQVDINVKTLDPKFNNNQYLIQDKVKWLNSKKSNKRPQRLKDLTPPEIIPLDINVKTLNHPNEQKFFVQDKERWLDSRIHKPSNSDSPEIIPLDVIVKTVNSPDKDYFIQDKKQWLNNRKTKANRPSIWHHSDFPEIISEENIKSHDSPDETKDFFIQDKEDWLNSKRNIPNRSKRPTYFRNPSLNKLDRNAHLENELSSEKYENNIEANDITPEDEVQLTNGMEWPALPPFRENIKIDLNEISYLKKGKRKGAIHNTNNNFFLISDKPEQIIISLSDQYELDNSQTDTVGGHHDNKVDESNKPGIFSYYERNDNSLRENTLDEKLHKILANEVDLINKNSFNPHNENVNNLNVQNNKSEKTHRITSTNSAKPPEKEEFLDELIHSNIEPHDEFTDDELSALILNSFANINRRLTSGNGNESPNFGHDIREYRNEHFFNEQRRNLVLDQIEIDKADSERIVLDPNQHSFTRRIPNEIEPTKIIRNERGDISSKPIVHSLRFDDVLPNVIIITNKTQNLHERSPLSHDFRQSHNDDGKKHHFKSPVIVVSTAEAEDNNLKQEKVYINTILPDNFSLSLQQTKTRPTKGDQSQFLYSPPNPYGFKEEDRRDRFKVAMALNNIHEEILRVQNFPFHKENSIK